MNKRIKLNRLKNRLLCFALAFLLSFLLIIKSENGFGQCSAGTAIGNPINLCEGDSILLVLAGYTPGSFIQWQYFAFPGWLSIVGPGGTSDSLWLTPTTSETYRAIVGCPDNNIAFSNLLTVNVVPGFSLSLESIPTTCFGFNNGSINMSITGGTGNFSVLWSNGSTIQNLTGLSPGFYTVTVTDAGGCVRTADTLVFDTPQLFTTILTQNEGCGNQLNGAANLFVFGGTPPYSFFWLHGETNQNLVNMAAGTYFVIVSDVNGCSTGDIAYINLGIPQGTQGIWNWTGGYSNDWFFVCNWDKQIAPNDTSIVIIPANTPFSPHISGGLARCKTIEIASDSGANLTIFSDLGGVLRVMD